MKKKCHVCGTRPTTTESPEHLLCTPCLRWAEAENQHSDDAHDMITAGEEMHISEDNLAEIVRRMKSCDICLGKPDPATIEPTKGHTNTQAKSYISHAGCEHARTPKAREICRRARRAGAAQLAPGELADAVDKLQPKRQGIMSKEEIEYVADVIERIQGAEKPAPKRRRSDKVAEKRARAAEAAANQI